MIITVCLAVTALFIFFTYLYIRKLTSHVSGVCSKCNIILISVDSLRADHVGALGYHRDTTPNFDKLSKKGFLFENYFTTSYLTPFSEMSVHTGMYQQSHGVTNFNVLLPSSKQTLAEYLKSKNFSTLALISSPEFIVNPALEESFSRGFDGYYYAATQRSNPPIPRIKKELRNLEGKQFFLWLPLGGVHWPYLKKDDIFSDKSYDGFLKDKYLQWPDFQYIYKNKVYPAQTSFTDKDLQYVIDQYDNGVRGFDDFLGQVLVILEEKKLLNNTIIIIQSEHGESLGEHGYIAHYDIHETETHTPLLIILPTLKNGKRIQSFASPVDILPTIKNILEGDLDKKSEGESLLPILNGLEKDGLRNEVFMERNPLWEEVDDGIISILKNNNIKLEHKSTGDIAIRTNKWKYILRLDKKRVEEVSWWKFITSKKIDVADEELYDMTIDPYETRNVVKDYPQEASQLKQKVLKWHRNHQTSSSSEYRIKGKIQPYF